MPAGRAGAAFAAIPGAATAQAADQFIDHLDTVSVGSGATFTLPAITTGAAFTVDGLDQQVFSALQAAMAGSAGVTLPPSRCQPLMPLLTL